MTELATTSAGQPFGRVAAIDFGTVRMGIAISDPSRIIASPLENYVRRSASADAERMRRLAQEEQISLFVVGLPIHLDGRESEKSRQARAFASWLQSATQIDVTLFDERFTTAHANELLRMSGFSRNRKKRRLDMIAAQILLAAFLEAGCPRGDPTTSRLDDPGTE